MANTGLTSQSRQRALISRRRYLKFELLDQRRVLASMTGEVVGGLDPALQVGDGPTSSELRIVYLDIAGSPSGTSSGSASDSPTPDSESVSAESLWDDRAITADELGGGDFAGDRFAGGEIVASTDLLAYAIRGAYLSQIDLEAGSTASLELPAPILSAQLLSDGRLLVLLEPAQPVEDQHEAGEGAEAEATPGLLVVSFDSGQWKPVAGGESDLAGFAAALARGDRGLLVPAEKGAEAGVLEADEPVTLRSLHVDPGTQDVVLSSLPFQVAAGSQVLASPSGPLALISQPSEGGRRISLWSTRVDAAVVGSEQTLPGVSDILMFDDATSLAVARQSDGGIQILDGANRFAALHTFSEWTGPVAMDATREWLFGVREDRTLEIFDIREGRLRHTLPLDRLPLDMAASEVAGGLALAGGGSRLILSTSAGVAQLRLDRLESQRTQVRSDAQTDARTIDQLFGDLGGEGESQSLTSFSSSSQADIEPGEVSVPENEFGAMIAHIFFSGPDASQDFSLHVEDDRYTLDGSVLQLALDSAFDYEVEPVVRVEVVVSSLETGGSVGRHTIVINVLDYDDPITDIQLDRQEIPERTAGYIVSPVRVMDQDSNDHTLTVDDGRFEIDNGNLKLREGVFVRRSDQAEILVTVTASDNEAMTASFAKEFLLTVTANESPLHNPSGPTDVNGDGQTDPLDALIVLNILNQGGPTAVGDLTSTGGDDTYFYDVNGDGLITPLDALIIINEINRRGGGQAESNSDSGGTTGGLSGEGEAAPLEYADTKSEPAEPLPVPDSPVSPAEKIQTRWRDSVATVSPAPGLRESETSDPPSDDPSSDQDDPRAEFFSGLDFHLS